MNRSKNLLLAAIATHLLTGCLRTAQDRAERDETIGRAQIATVEVTVSEGHAAVRELNSTRLELWQSAPSIQLSLRFSELPADDFTLDVSNCMPGAGLSVLETSSSLASADASVSAFEQTEVEAGTAAGNVGHLLPSITTLDTGRATRCRFSLSLPAPGSYGLQILAPVTESSAFRFALMSDVQEAIDDVQDIYQKLNATENLDFLLGAGDLTQQGDRAQLERFEQELLELNIPYYTTLGNHELGVTPNLYQDFFGRVNFSFLHRGVRFTLLDSASATLDPLVYDKLKGWLDAGRAGLHIVAMHIPPLDPSGVRNGAFANRNEAAKLLGSLAEHGVDLTLYGHVHSYYEFENAGIPARISGGGGAIPERLDNIGRHFLVVSADPIAQTVRTEVVRVD